jgi:hypothetical protein
VHAFSVSKSKPRKKKPRRRHHTLKMWRYVPPKRRTTFTRLHSDITQKIVILEQDMLYYCLVLMVWSVELSPFPPSDLVCRPPSLRDEGLICTGRSGRLLPDTMGPVALPM